MTTSTRSRQTRRPKTEKGTYECAQCGEIFKRWRSNMRNRSNAFCSKPCFGAYRRTAVLIACDGCGEAIERTQGRLSLYKAHFCSSACHSRSMRAPSVRRGYRVVTDDEGRGFEHRKIMEKHLGRTLSAGDVVHHRNGNTLDNRLENLQVMSWSEHSAHHNPISWNPEDAVAMRLEGLTYREVSLRLGVTSATIRQGLRRRGLLVPGRGGRARTWPLAEARELRLRGMSYAAIAQRFGVTAGAIFQGIKRANKLEHGDPIAIAKEASK